MTIVCCSRDWRYKGQLSGNASTFVDGMADSAEPLQTALYEQSDLGLLFAQAMLPQS